MTARAIRSTRPESAISDAVERAVAAGRVRFDEAARAWTVASYEAARAILDDRDSLGARPVQMPAASLAAPLDAAVRRGLRLHSLWLGIHPEAYPHVRVVAAAALMPRSLAQVERSLRLRSENLLERAIASSARDIDVAFVRPFVHDSLLDLFSVPTARRSAVVRIVDHLAGFLDRSPSAIVRAAVAQTSLSAELTAVLATPAPVEALVLHAVQRALEESVITEDEALGMLSVLLFAGLHTSLDALSALLARLASDAPLRDAIATGAVTVDAAVEESLRLSLEVRLDRFTTRDIVAGETVIPAGARLRIDFGAANRDESRFPSPETFDASRRDGEHLSFGAGLHRCVGRHFARLELAIAAESFLRAFPALAAAGTFGCAPA